MVAPRMHAPAWAVNPKPAFLLPLQVIGPVRVDSSNHMVDCSPVCRSKYWIQMPPALHSHVLIRETKGQICVTGHAFKYTLICAHERKLSGVLGPCIVTNGTQ